MSEDNFSSLTEDSIITQILEEELAESDQEEKPQGDPLSISYFDKQLSSIDSAEEKIHHALNFMKICLDNAGAPYFKGFWHARQTATQLFKENINTLQRSELWKNYRDLCQEFRKLKEVLDENASFASEQIEIAVNALSQELDQFELQVSKQPDIELPFKSQVIERNFDFYNSFQKQLSLLNAYALRINGLRKELIKTEMRIRVKNKFFKDLSLLGDKVFPLRKELIKNLSTKFIEDINQFIDKNFRGKEVVGAFFFLREEIKSLQSIAKELTLNTHAFTSTRTKLSECWDLVKAADKDKKKELAEKRSIFKQNEESIQLLIEELKTEIIDGKVDANSLPSKVDEIIQKMKTVELGKEERIHLRDLLNLAQKPILDKLKEEEEEKAKAHLEYLRQKAEKFEALKDNLTNLIASVHTLEPQAIEESKEAITKELILLNPSRAEKISIEKLFKMLKDLIQEKHEQALLNLSEDDQSYLSKLKIALVDRESSRKEIKEQIDLLKKQKTSGSLSFEKALQVNELIEEEKERLEKIESSLQEIQNKIKEISKKAK